MDNSSKRIRIAAAAVCLCFILTTFLAELYIHKNSHHHCVGEECTVCCHLQEARTVLNQLISGAAPAVFYLAAFIIVVLGVGLLTPFFDSLKKSPVQLRVRLNN